MYGVGLRYRACSPKLSQASRIRKIAVFERAMYCSVCISFLHAAGKILTLVCEAPTVSVDDQVKG